MKQVSSSHSVRGSPVICLFRGGRVMRLARGSVDARIGFCSNLAAAADVTEWRQCVCRSYQCRPGKKCIADGHARGAGKVMIHAVFCSQPHAILRGYFFFLSHPYFLFSRCAGRSMLVMVTYELV